MKFDNENGNNRLIEANIVMSATMVTLLGGGELFSAELDAALARAPRLVAADGGAKAALDAGKLPDAVIGDLDSFPPDVAAQIPSDRVYHIPEQETSDFDKALRSIEARLVIAVGFTGQRLDHELTAFHTLVARRSPPCILLGARDIIFAAPARLKMTLQDGARVSLFPMARVQGRSKGLRWPIEGLTFAPGERIGTSNKMTGPELDLSFDHPGMLVILPKRFLDVAIAAMTEFALPPGDTWG